MRILMISKACLVGAYQRKLEEIAVHPDAQLTVAVPPEWRDERGVLNLERAHTQGYRLVVEPMAFNGSFHLHFYPQLARLLTEIKPDIVHIDEEPYNLATWHAMKLARRSGAKTLFFSWQNLNRRYPFPWGAMEADVLRRADYAICGNREAESIWRAKGYRGRVAVIPQFGVDTDLFSPRPPPQPSPVVEEHDGRGGSDSPLLFAKQTGEGTGVGGEVFTIAYAGRFVPEKGVDVLIRAAARLDADVRLILLGSGPRESAWRRLAADCGIAPRIQFKPWISSLEFPEFLRTIDALVLSSITQPNWKEQFGRVLIEAMACGVPVIGSTCGEIPNVIGDAGLIVPESDPDALADALRRLQYDTTLRAGLSQKGRERVLAHFTQKRIAEETVRVYREMVYK